MSASVHFPVVVLHKWHIRQTTVSCTCLLLFTLMVVHMAAVLSKLSELPAAVFTLPFQVLLHSALLSMRGLFHVPPEQSLLKELLPTHVTPNQEYKG